MNNTESKEPLYTLDWDNECGANDESYSEWYNLMNPEGETIAKIPDQRDANKLLKAINNLSSLAEALQNLVDIMKMEALNERYPLRYDEAKEALLKIS